MTTTNYVTKAFSYNMLKADELPEYEKLLERLFVHFTKFFRSRKWSVDKAYDHWWVWYGPVSFYTNEDCFRFRRELKAFIIGKYEQLMEGVSDEQSVGSDKDSNEPELQLGESGRAGELLQPGDAVQ